MAEPRFNIRFQGKLVGGADPATVKANLMRLFNIDDARADKLMGGSPVILKKNADQPTAMKFRAALKKAGAICELVPLTESGEAASSSPASAAAFKQAPSKQAPSQPAPSQSTQSQTETPAAPAGAGRQDSGDLEMVKTLRTHGMDFVGDYQVAAPGADLEQITDNSEPVNPDTSDLSLAPAGTDMGQKEEPAPPPAPDISGLSLAPDDS